MADTLTTYDCTLRDGGQGLGITLSVEDKLRIVTRLDQFGIDIVEGGFPASNPKDLEFFRRAADLSLKHTRLAAFGSTCRKQVAAEECEGLAALLASGAPVVTLVGKAWDLQVQDVLQTSLEENLRMVRDSVAFIKQAGRFVVFDAEHFFDGYASNADYALQVLQTAAQAGADCVCLCETNGGALPSQVSAATAQVCQVLEGVQLGIHCHNDSGCAVANSIAAIEAGATQVQGTINGYGERAGNCDLLCTIADLQLKAGWQCVDDFTQLTSVANYVAEICNLSLPAQTPYVGSAAFAHKGGLHASALVKNRSAYEHTDPALVGNTPTVLVSELAGRASLVQKAAQLGFDLSGEENIQTVDAILAEVKQREAAGYSFDKQGVFYI